MERQNITEPLDVGVRAINSLMTVGRASAWDYLPDRGSEEHIAWHDDRFTSADVVVVGLVASEAAKSVSLSKTVLVLRVSSARSLLPRRLIPHR